MQTFTIVIVLPACTRERTIEAASQRVAILMAIRELSEQERESVQEVQCSN